MSSTTRISKLFHELRHISERSNAQDDIRVKMNALGGRISATDVDAIMREAESGSAVAQCLAGAVLVEGWSATRDRTKGVHWYERGATAGNDHAQFVLGGMHEYGFCLPKDVNRAAEMYRLAAAQGHGQAQSSLGIMLLKFEVYPSTASAGSGPIGNEALQASIREQQQEGLRLLEEAAGKGVWTAMFNLALAYEEGSGVSVDRDEALRRYRRLANKGHAKARAKVRELGGSFLRRVFVRRAVP